MPGMEMLPRCSCVFLLLVSMTDFTSTESTGQGGPYFERFKRQIRAPKTELIISSLCIQSTIVSRYAYTKVQSVMSNPHAEAKEAIFDLDLPSSAFISNFTLTVNGKIYVAEVKEKHQAKKMFDEARRQGKTTAHVGTRDRETEKFRVMVNVEAGGEIGFTLTYEELLRRQLGKYEHTVSVRPGQVVQNLTVEVTISERTGIEYVRVLPLRTSRLLTNTVQGDTEIPPCTEIETSTHCARITFSPSPAEQAAYSSSGITADFVIQYDVTLKDLAGDVQIYNGYFVHYFAPRGLPAIQKNVVFVIDVSGSMFGTKISQTKSAMHVILNDLHRDDFFNIITFSDDVQVWKPGRSIQASAQNIKSAKEYVNKIEADGWTDINAALLAAAAIFNQTSPKQEKGFTKQRIPLIIFLTDGEATSGVTSTTKILKNAHKAMGGTISLFCLAFGEDADYNLMRRLSLENRGIARRIYEYSDGTLQLKGFYDEVASPLLFDIELAYLGETTYNVTQTLFPNYFQGSELVVAGKLKSGVKSLQIHLTANDQKKKLSLENDISIEDNVTQSSFGCLGNVDEIQWFVQRLWAYFTIKDLLLARIKANDTVARRLLTEKATNLSIKYNFVTPVTSLIVVKPEDHEDVTTLATTSLKVTTKSSTISLPTSTISPTSSAILRTKITSGPRLTKPVTRSPKPSTTLAINPTGPMSPITSTSPGNKGVSVTVGPTTINHALEKLPTVAPTSNSVSTTNIDAQQSLTVYSTAALLTHTATPVGPTKARTDKPLFTLLTGIHPTNFVTVPATESRTELSTPSDATSLLVTEQGAHRTHDTLSPVSPSSDPMNPTSLRLLIFPDELLQSEVTFPAYEESLNPPPVYSFFPEVSGTTAIYDSDDLDYEPFSDTLDTFVDFDGFSAGALGLQTFMSSVDGDPHFVVNLPSTQEKLCFTLDGRPGDILRLVSDPTGITVNGHLMEAPLKIGSENRLRTYLDTITIIINRPRSNYIINISLHNLTLKGEDQLTLPFHRPTLLQKPRLAIRIAPSSNVTVWIGRNVEFLILFHHYQHPTYLQLDHLGFYIVKGDGLSSSSSGLLGQFQNAQIQVKERKQSNDLTISGILTCNNHMAPATLVTKSIKDSAAHTHMTKCWLVKHGDIEDILDGKYTSYVVSHLQKI
ncbi:inter-alpha-trypsin inhibitor heavy chain H6 [Spea bombifrons]|uniref:inter-alpha-trypsin inhibitor heavy chain H6 n=1 Tax=Spea bombifrons TaxID=233779 RepID=UPI00234AC5F3|nr:inter-alpha-trypsin inhibitor heavy chain H6 [Spea bombifrons]